MLIFTYKSITYLLTFAALTLASPLNVPKEVTNSVTRTGLCSLPNNAALGLKSSADGGPVCAFTATVRPFPQPRLSPTYPKIG